MPAIKIMVGRSSCRDMSQGALHAPDISPSPHLRWGCERTSDMRFLLRLSLLIVTSLGMLVITQSSEVAANGGTVANPLCAGETAFYSPENGEDIVVPQGYTVSAFATGLNSPTGIAFQGNAKKFKVYVLESGHGLPSKCNEQESFGTG